ncbi:MAG: glycosyltransferase family 2 protein [Endomicrobiaceae bacterium]|jgi:glycosyltransferase involved in cell wall biosynthesis|nr:glycosyltransferase family 2 protein [Endomicrobiaceae bacterium]MDD3730661.1 glycosyltransferase family 2 protein [Endomicrobiaceae bacterium]MDD4166549.1 glycosyltransferase family 2 protein [Endomicrobiaceae bacterium]
MKSKVIVVMPAYNASKTLKQTIDAIPVGSFSDILLVDDNSKDDTVEKAKELGLKVIKHDKNMGYGGNQKTCYRTALEMGADIVVMLHPDYQYDPRLVPFLAGLIENDICDVMMANRIRTRKEALKGGMPFYKYFFNRCLTITENIILGLNLGEYHTGYRAFSRKVLETIDFEKNSDDFVFDQHIIVQIAVAGFRIGEIPVAAKYFDEASSINFIRSVEYGLGILAVLAKYILFKLKLKNFEMFNITNKEIEK